MIWWPFRNWKKLREVDGHITFACRKCFAEFSIPTGYGVVHHRCLGCGVTHKVWTGKDSHQRQDYREGSQKALKVNRIALKIDSSGRVRVVGEIENVSDNSYGHLTLFFDVYDGSSSHFVAAFPGVDIVRKLNPEEKSIRPRSKLEFNHWLITLDGKVKKDAVLVIKDIELSGDLQKGTGDAAS